MILGENSLYLLILSSLMIQFCLIVAGPKNAAKYALLMVRIK